MHFHQEQQTDGETTASLGQRHDQERRYRPETVQQIIAAAAEMQNEHQETLSAQQVEAIGAEVGLDPTFVRRAIASIEAEGHAGQVRSVKTTLGARIGPVRLSRRQKEAAVLAPVAFAAVSLLLAVGPEHSVSYPLVRSMLYAVGPAFVVALSAALRSKRLGLLSGSLTGALFILAIVWAQWMHHPNIPGDAVAAFFTTAAVGGATGLLSAAARQSLPRAYHALETRLVRLTMPKSNA